MKSLYQLFSRSMPLKLFCASTMLLYSIFQLYRMLTMPGAGGAGSIFYILIFLFLLQPARNILLLISSRAFITNRGMNKKDQIEKFSSLNQTHWIIEGVAMLAFLLVFLVTLLLR